MTSQPSHIRPTNSAGFDGLTDTEQHQMDALSRAFARYRW